MWVQGVFPFQPIRRRQLANPKLTHHAIQLHHPLRVCALQAEAGHTLIHKPPNDSGIGVDLSLRRLFLMLKRDAQEKRSHHPLYDLAHQQMICSSPPSMAEFSEASTPGRLCWYRWPSILPSNACMLVALCSMIGIFPGIGWSLKEWCHYCRRCVGLTRPM